MRTDTLLKKITAKLVKEENGKITARFQYDKKILEVALFNFRLNPKTSELTFDYEIIKNTLVEKSSQVETFLGKWVLKTLLEETKRESKEPS